MYLVNEKNENIIDMFDVRLNDISYNRKKFKEMMKLSNIKLDKQFCYKLRNRTCTSHGKGPLYYPISTFLLANYLNDDLSKYMDKEILEYMVRTMNCYDPTDLFSIDYLIGNDEMLKEDVNIAALEDYLRSIDVDLVIFREIFKKAELNYMGSIDVSFLKKYVMGHRNGILPGSIYNMYMAKDDAERNSKVLRLLRLEPKKINLPKDI